MKRRHVLAALAGAAAWPYAAGARETPVRIGFLAGGAATSINSAYQIRTIKQGLADNGLVEGSDYGFEARFAMGDYDRFPELARDLAKIGVSMVLVNAAAAARAVRQLAPQVPVIMIGVNAPNGTGIAAAGDMLAPKMLELQRAVLPNGNSIAVLYNPADAPDHDVLEEIRERATASRMSVTPIAFQSRNDLEAAFGKLAKTPPAVVHVLLDPGTSDFIDRIPALALMHRLPAFASSPDFATFGGLVGYGTPREQLYLRAGVFVKTILDGANGGDLRVEQPPRSELWINRNTAKALNLSLPAPLLASADKVIG
jgi:putative tryptophan/tyrosine transport system substrate-binding protein